MRAHHILGLSLASLAPLTLAAACGGGNDPPPFVPGTGGTDAATGGTNPLGGAPGSGGQGESSGGGDLGGATNMGGMGGVATSVPDFVGPEPCATDKDCTSQGLLCDAERRVCAECIESSDCGDGGVCERGACTSLETCQNSLGCSSDEVCVKGEGESGVCQECGKEADCAEGNSCVDGTCRLDCDSDKDCTGGGLLCSEELGLCAECIESSDCGSGETCSQGECIAAICTPGQTQCLDNAVITCREDGQGYLEPKDCAERDCAFSDGGAFCSADGSGGPRGEVILEDTFSAGSGRWGLSGGASDPNPNVTDGRLCVSDGTFTLGWPADDGAGFDLPEGDYILSFVTQASGSVGNLNAKVALAVEPFSPVYADEPVDVSAGGSHEVSFHVSDSLADNVGIAFNVGGNQGTLCFDEVLLTAE